MSPRRKFQPGEGRLLAAQAGKPQRQWEFPLLATVAAALMVAAIMASTVMRMSHVSVERTEKNDREVVSYVKWFMTGFTTIDPYHANAYVDRVLAQATGDFAKHFQETANEILVQVAQAEPATGTVLDAGVERWNDDGSANVLVAAAVTSKSPDEKQVFHSVTRWMATAKQEGNQWKISNLLQVI